jgi:hypothetical protein
VTWDTPHFRYSATATVFPQVFYEKNHKKTAPLEVRAQFDVIYSDAL